MATTSWRKIAISSAVIIGLGGFLAATLITVRLYRRHRSITLRGAVVKQNVDTRNQSPIADVEVRADDGLAALDSKSDFSGAFRLSLPPGSRRGQPITLTFRHPDYQPLTLKEVISDNLYVIRIAQMFGVHPTQVGGWKKQALAGLPDVFGNGREQMRQQADTEKDELYKQIGQLKVELDFLKKRAGLID
jgi:hypothetical protein